MPDSQPEDGFVGAEEFGVSLSVYIRAFHNFLCIWCLCLGQAAWLGWSLSKDSASCLL